jgi:outer membrane cobalamin receptor
MMAVLAIGAMLAGTSIPPSDDDASASATVPSSPARTAGPTETVVVGQRDAAGALREDRTSAGSVVRPADSPRAFDDLGQMLLEVPGVITTRTGSLGSYATISLRGSSPDEVRIYLDGVPLNGASGGAVDVSALPLGDVERVEVYRGSSPLAFGESALGGVVSITTRTPGAPQLEVRGGVASFGTRYADLTGGGQVGRVKLYAGVHGLSALGDYGYRNDNGTAANPDDDVYMARQNNDLREASGVVRAALVLPGRRSLNLAGIGFGREQGLTGRGANPTVRSRFATRRGLGYLRYQSRDDLGPGGELSAQVYVSDQRDRIRDPEGELGLGGPHQSREVSQALGTTVNGSRPLTDWLRAAAVLEARRETFQPSDAVDTVPVGIPARRSTGVAGTELDVYWRQLNLDVIASARLELVNDVVTQGATVEAPTTHHLPVVRAGFERPLGAHATLKANLGRYARMPTFVEFYGNGTGRLVGNPELVPERGTNGDVALWIDRERVTSRTAVFGALVDDLIRWQSASWGQARPDNLARARVWGVEQELRLALGRHVRTVAQLTYLQAIDQSDNAASRGHQLPLHPRLTGYLRPELVAVPLPAGMTLAGYVDVALRSETYADNVYLLRLRPRALVGCGLTVAAPRTGLRLTASIVNLTDDRRTDFVDWALPGRALFATLAYSPVFDQRYGQ